MRAPLYAKANTREAEMGQTSGGGGGFRDGTDLKAKRRTIRVNTGEKNPKKQCGARQNKNPFIFNDTNGVKLGNGNFFPPSSFQQLIFHWADAHVNLISDLTQFPSY